MEKKERTCFIITPIGECGSAIRRKIDGLIDEVITPVLDEFGFEIAVSHRINESGSVTNSIIRNIYESDLVIANLTNNNPNVMYEVAIRHASAKPIIHITENIATLPFDINDQRTIEYVDDIAGAIKLKNDLRSMIEGVDYENLSANPITDALEKKNLINIPKERSQDLGEMIFQLQDDMKSLKRSVAVISMDTNVKTSRMKDYFIYLNSKDKCIVENVAEIREEDIDK